MFLAFAALAFFPASAPADGPAPWRELRPVFEFTSISDREARSVALYLESAKVFQHPRCLNCHPSTRSPTQGDNMHPHMPYINARAGGHGSPGMHCTTCHQGNNVTTLGAAVPSIPGNRRWGLAPAPMAWQGKTGPEICEQLKDHSRNGGRNLDQIREHVMTDTLVGWAWNPGDGRTAAPGSQAEFGALVSAWIDTGAACPR